jgi:hypothetical protein
MLLAKRSLQARLLEASSPSTATKLGKAITEYTPRRILEASDLPKLELDEGELVASPKPVKVSAAPSGHVLRRLNPRL